MLIAFVLAETGHPVLKGGEGLSGLAVFREPDAGPFYPQLIERRSEQAYRWFAGRVLDSPCVLDFPIGHPVAKPTATAWSFSGNEPDGSWLALKFDRRSDTFSIAADLFGLQRWFYTEQDGVWFAANSLRWLHRMLPQKPALEWRAVPYLLRTGRVPPEFTPLAGVYRLPAGQTLTIENGKGELRERAALPVARREPRLQSGIASRLLEAVARETEGLDSVAVPLSGDMHERFLLAAALWVRPPETVTAMTAGSEQSSEHRLAALLAAKCGLQHRALGQDPRPLRVALRENFAVDEGLSLALPEDSVPLWPEELSRQTGVLSGHLGDAVFGSHEAPGNPPLAARIRERETLVPWEDIEALLNDDGRDPLQVEARLRDLPGSTVQEQQDQWYFRTYAHRGSAFPQTPAYCGMPYLHRRVLEEAFALSPEARLGQQAFRAAMKTAFPEFWAFPLSPKRRGMPGPPGDDLLRQENHGPVLEALFTLESAAVFNRPGIDKLRQRYLRRKSIPRPLLGALLTLHQWMLHYPTR